MEKFQRWREKSVGGVVQIDPPSIKSQRIDRSFEEREIEEAQEGLLK